MIKQILNEMAFSKDDFENYIVNHLRPIIEHFVKLKMTDRKYVSRINSKIYSHTIHYRRKWQGEITAMVRKLFYWINDTQLKLRSPKKHKYYLSALMQVKHNLDAAAETVSENDKLYQMVLDWLNEKYNQVIEESWYQNILNHFTKLSSFLIGNTADVDKILGENRIFINQFTKDFDK